MARFHLGLGDPPLFVADPEIEYLPKPGEYKRFGNRVFYNRHHMRAPEADQFRVLLIGDSVLNGLTTTDQSELISTVLSEELGVSVGNVSAGSWGPPNMLAYARRFGLFGAEVVVLLVSSHDVADIPNDEPVVGAHPNFPGNRPPLALLEGATRYLPRYVPMLGGSLPPDPTVARATPPAAEAMGAMQELVTLARGEGAQVLLALHWERGEQAAPHPGHAIWLDFAAAMDLPVVELELPVDAYRDPIHLTPRGQRLYAQQLRPLIEQHLKVKADLATP